MRPLLVVLALVSAPAALAGCASHHNNQDPRWKENALAQCAKETDPLKHQTCMDEIAAVEHERSKAP